MMAEESPGPDRSVPVYAGFANAKLPDTDYRVAFAHKSNDFRSYLVLPERPTALPARNFVPLDVREGMGMRNALAILKIPCIIRRLRVDYAHFFATQFALLGPPLARLAGAKSIITVTGTGRALENKRGIRAALLRTSYQRLFRLSARLSQLVLFQNPDDMKMLSAILPLATRSKCHLIGSGIDESYFEPINRATSQRDLPICLLVARLIPSKGIGDFLELARRLEEDAVFVLVGPSSGAHPELLKSVNEASARGLIEYRGQMSDSEVRALYREIDLLVFPSISEGLPRVVLEASLSFRPVVTYNIPACRAVLPDGQHLVPVGDVSKMEAEVRKLVIKPELRRELASTARKKVLQDFSSAAYTERLESLIASSSAISQAERRGPLRLRNRFAEKIPALNTRNKEIK